MSKQILELRWARLVLVAAALAGLPNSPSARAEDSLLQASLRRTGAEPLSFGDATDPKAERFVLTPADKPVFDQQKRLVLDGKKQFLLLPGTMNEWVKSGRLHESRFTIEVWVRPDRAQPWGGFMSAIQDNGNFERGWMLGIRGDRFCFGLASRSTKRLTYLSAPSGFTAGYWYHVVATYDGQAMKLYVDGKPVAQSKAQRGPVFYAKTGRVALGAYVDDNERYPIAGRIDTVSQWGRPLAKEEVARRFDDGKRRFRSAVAVVETVKGWPTYMHDQRRSGVTGEAIQLPLRTQWQYQCANPPSPAWPPPAKQDFWHKKSKLTPRVTYDRAFHTVSDGSVVVFGTSSDDRVVCLDLVKGNRLWQFFTEGPVRLAPTMFQDRVYFGSDDGRIYCLNDADGKLIWRRRAVDQDRRIPGNGRIISSLPVRTDLLVDTNQIRCAAGLFPRQGAYQLVFETRTGKRLARGPVNFSPQGYLERRGGSLMVSAGRAPKQLLARMKARGKETPMAPAGSVPDSYAVIGAPGLRFVGRDGLVVALDAKTGKTVWKAPVQGRAYGLAVAGGRLLVSTDKGMIYCFGQGRSEPLKHRENKLAFSPPAAVGQSQGLDQLLQPSRKSWKGYALVLGASDGTVIRRLAATTGLSLVVVDNRPEPLASLQRRLQASPLASRVSFMRVDSPTALPFGDGIFNLICTESPAAFERLNVPAGEVARVLRPSGGLAVFERSPQVAGGKWTRGLDPKWIRSLSPGLIIERPDLPGAGEWSHMYANPANTGCSNDSRVGSRLKLQWFGGPGPRDMVDRHHRTTPPLSVAGRMFVPGNDKIIAVDAYNGTVLWEKQLAEFRRVGALRDAGNMVATRDRLYAVAKNRCHVLESQTGAVKAAWKVADLSGDDRHDWGYLACQGNLLYGSATRRGAARQGHSKRQISETYYDQIPIVTSVALFCADRISGRRIWAYKPKSGAVVNPTITLGEGRMYFVESNNRATLNAARGRSRLQELLKPAADIVALDAKTGDVLWKRSVDLKQVEHHLFLCFSKGNLIAIGTRNEKAASGLSYVWYDVLCFDGKTGKQRWSATQNQKQRSGGSHGEQDHHPVVVGDTVYVEPYAYRVSSGERVKEWNLRRNGHGCGTMSASANTFFFRATNPTMYDIGTRSLQRVTTVSRPGCWINMIPAGGMLLIPEASSGCTCNFSIQCSMAFWPVDTSQPSKRP